MPHKILVIDDDELLRDSLGEALKDHQFDVFTAKDGNEGLSVAEEERPDLILLDIAMPGLDGLSFLKRLRESGEWGAHVKTIFLSSLEPEDTINAYINKTEPAYYLVKSRHNNDDIVAKVKEVLAR